MDAHRAIGEGQAGRQAVTMITKPADLIGA